MIIAGNFYAVTGLVSALVCLAILICNNTIYDRKNVIRSYFSFLLTVFIMCDIVDCIWGFMNTKTLNLGRLGFNIASYLIHLLIILSISCWCIFLTNYFGFRESRMAMILQCIPLVIAIGIFVTQIMDHTVFYIDDECNYYSGPYRLHLFAIQYSYYLITLVKIIYFLIRHRKEHSLRYRMIVFECAVVPVFFGILQYYNTNAPYSSMGLMFSAIIVFNGMMVIEKHRRSHDYETISKEMYRGLDALSDSFVSVVLIDLENCSDMPIKTSPHVDSLQKPNMDLRERIMVPFVTAAAPEFKEKLEEFADIDTMNERMFNRRSISMQYRSEEIGWVELTFVAAERDEARNLKKVVMAIRSIDERKRKEQEYENALIRAYKDDNAVLAELIKMESTGVVASVNRKIIIVNDAALEMFDAVGTDPIGSSVLEFWNSHPCVKVTDEVRKRSHEIEASGGEYSYQTVITKDDEDDVRHLRVDVKRVELLDGTPVMLTCFTDITAGKQLEEKLRMLSETDSLTRMANRRCGESQIKLLISEGVPGIYGLFDVNGFKTINDTFGHQTGDDTLVAVSKAVKASFRSDDVFMRLGGDEFAIYMRGVATPELARIRIARLFENIARIELPNIPKGSVSISFGAVIVETKEDVPDIDALYIDVYKRADTQMYKCKGKPGSNMSIEDPKKTQEGSTDEES